jgi:cyclopropane-fatty-acyl-phospholipid synthase
MDLSPREVSLIDGNRKSPDLNGVSPSPGTNGRVQSLAEWLFHKLLPGVPVPIRIILWNGSDFATMPGQPIATVRIHDRQTFLRLLLNPDLGFGDGYTDGGIELEGDLVLFIERVYQLQRASETTRAWRRWLAGWLARPHANSLTASRENIHHHYDIGNDFYRLWLDEQLVYTCAYFPTPDLTLEQAQIAKMDHVCRKLRLQPGETVVEAGCGWGALALHMARHYGVTVKAFNISHEQIANAQERARAEGLQDRVQFVEDDYRNIGGRYDVFVSVGMLEHVGLNHYREFGGIIHRCLKPAGRGLLHFIGRNRPNRTSPWLEKRIFPGAYMPCLREAMRVFEPWQFSVLDVENLRLHYARTLDHWLRRFEQAVDQVEKMFDQRFVRAWRLYLASSMAGFTTGHVQLFQIVFAGATNNDIPWSRAHIYQAS